MITYKDITLCARTDCEIAISCKRAIEYKKYLVLPADSGWCASIMMPKKSGYECNNYCEV
jgi:hypothetical protein